MNKQQVMHAAACMVAVDGKVDEYELQFLDRLADRIGAPATLIEISLDKVKAGNDEVYLPENVSEKRRLFYLLVQAAVANKAAVPQERKLLEHLARKMGISRPELERSVNTWLKRVIEDEQPSESLIAPPLNL